MSMDQSRISDSDASVGDRDATGVTDAPTEIGDTSDLAEAERLEEERARRQASDQPDLPDRAFDRITPQV